MSDIENSVSENVEENVQENVEENVVDATNGATPTTFDECLTLFGEQMKESYTINEQGETVVLPDEQMTDIVNIIEASQERVSECFKPLFDNLAHRIETNKIRIDQLLLLLREQEQHKARLPTSSANASKTISVASAEDAEGLPTVEWLITNRKSKSGKAVTGYNCFTMWYMAQHKSGFPPKGIWDQQNKAAWNALAAQVSKGETTSVTAATSITSIALASTATAGNVEVPEIKGNGKKLTAYNMYTIEYMQKNPGKMPPKGSWGQVPKHEVERYQALADAAKAQRA